MATNRYGMVFFAAVVIAAGATFAVYKTVEASKASARIATVPVVVATRDIEEGLIVDRTSLTVAQWPQPTVPAGAFGNIDSVAGRVSKVPIFNGEPIVPGRLAPAGTGPGLEVRITPGKRGFPIRVNDVTSMSGLIQPNSRVDVLLTFNQSEDLEKRTAKLFMPNMRVLAMGSNLTRAEDGRAIQVAVATLETTPEESERLAVAETQGSIRLLLRGYGDPDSVETRGATTSDVAAQVKANGSLPPPRPAAAAPRRRPIEASPAPVTVQQPVQQAPAPIVAPPPVKPDSYAVRVIRGRTSEERKFAKDSARRDTIPD